MFIESNKNRILFIGGHRKSGTSMVRDLFDSHSAVSCYPPDLTVFYAYYPQFIKDHDTAAELIKRLERIVVQELELCYQDSNIPLPANIDEFRDYFFDGLSTPDQLTDMKNIISRIITCYREWSGDQKLKKEVNILKETSLEIYAHKIMNWFPNSQFLQIMRDPRDNYAALKAGVQTKYIKHGEDENITLMSLINRLGTSMRIGLVNQEIYSPNIYRIEKFENITTSPDIVMNDISKWAGIHFEKTLTTPSKFGQTTRGNNFEGKNFSKISSAHVGAWKERITEEDVKIIEFHLGDLMQKYGYTPEFTKEQTIAAASTFYEWNNYQYFYFDRFKNEGLSK